MTLYICRTWNAHIPSHIFRQVPFLRRWISTWKPQDRVLLGGFGVTSAFSTNTSKHVTGLLSGSLNKEYPVGETPNISSTFLNCFAAVHANFPCQDIRPLGWVHFSAKGWCSILTIFILKRFENQLMKIRCSSCTVLVTVQSLPFLQNFMTLQSRDRNIFFLLLLMRWV